MSRTIGLLLLVAICAVEPARLNSARHANPRLFQRQEAAPEAAPPAPTGYPAATTPEVPFDLPATSDKPEVTYLPPDNAYGPPDSPEAVYGPPESEQPESTYGTPPSEQVPEQPELKQQKDNEDDSVLLTVSGDGTVIAVSNTFDQDEPNENKGNAQQSSRLVYRLPQRREALALNSAPTRLLKLQRLDRQFQRRNSVYTEW